MKIFILLLGLLLSLNFIGCKSNNSVGGPGPSTPFNPYTCLAGTNGCFNGLNCEGLWQEELKNQPKGLRKNIRLDDKTVVDGRSTLILSAEEKVEILEQTSERIMKRVTFKVLYPASSSSFKIKVDEKTKFLEMCNKLGQNGLPLPSGIQVGGQILEERDEFISIIAGTFDTHYVKTKAQLTVGNVTTETTFENWMTKEFKLRLTAKAIMQIPSTHLGKTIINVKELELIDFFIP